MIKNESGRSMVEMLGVLAIIGVLSVGGIAGYTTAMRKFRANEIANAIAVLYAHCFTLPDNASNTVTYANTIGTLPTDASVLQCTATGANTAISVTVANAALNTAVSSILDGNTTLDSVTTVSTATGS